MGDIIYWYMGISHDQDVNGILRSELWDARCGG